MSNRYTEVPSYSSIKHTLEICKDNYWKKVFIGIYYTGARAGEIIQLKKNQIYIDSLKPDFINIDLPTEKNRRVHLRTITIHKDLEPIGFNLFNALKGDSDLPAFPRYPSGVSVTSYLRYMRKKANVLFGKIGGVIVAPHFFRHARATHLVKDFGFTSHELRQYMGWSDDRMGSVYVHLDKGALQSAFERRF
jgi:integrase